MTFRSILLGCVVWGLVLSGEAPAQDAASVKEHAKALSKAFRMATEAVAPSVVTIKARAKVVRRGPQGLEDLFQDPRFREFFPEGRIPIPRQEEGREPGPRENSENGDEEEDESYEGGTGSGVIIEATGLVLTNNHVVDGAESVKVRLNDGREFPAENIRVDKLSDLAVLQIKCLEKLPYAKLGDSSRLEIGDWVIAIGSPFDLEATVSAGIISGKGRSIHQIRRGQLLQTDAAINPGNSGGPLVNLDGEVVGINTAIASVSGGYQGIGFAIPSDRAQWVARELVANGKVRRAYLGISIGATTAAEGKKLHVPVNSGVVVQDVVESSPAGEAGIRAHDVIVEFSGKKVRNPRELQDIVEQHPLGSKQAVKLIREGEALTVQVALKALPENFERSLPSGPRK